MGRGNQPAIGGRQGLAQGWETRWVLWSCAMPDGSFLGSRLELQGLGPTRPTGQMKRNFNALDFFNCSLTGEGERS